jgi:hypothetical protein
MTHFKIQTFVILVFALSVAMTQAALESSSLAELIASSDAICRASSLESRPFEKKPNNRIFTSTGFIISEVFKGIFSNSVRVEHRGGELNGRGETYCDRPVFDSGEDYLLFMARREDDSLYCVRSISIKSTRYAAVLEQLEQQATALSTTGLDVSDQQANLISPRNFLSASTGFSSRFLQGDRAETIKYVVDMDTWPVGITSNEALSAVSNAFDAWSGTTTLSFKFDGVESFGMAAPDLNNDDGRIYVQLHDTYNHIAPSDILAQGGRAYTYSPDTWPDGGTGGRVGTNEFDRSTEGFLVVEHSKTNFANLASFEEVLCHEIGHILSLDHSSEDPDETNSVLKDATMYYSAHFDDRGAAIRTWDTDTIHVIHPLTNTPPFGYDRIIEAITQPGTTPAFATGVNQVKVVAYDLQDGASTILLTNNLYEANGTFSLVNGNTVFFTPAGYFPDAEAPPGSFFGRRFIRITDGVNMSPPIQIIVLSFNADGNKNLLQDSWATTHSVSVATADPDQDGLTNYQEWLLDFNPNNADSTLKVVAFGSSLSWTSKPEELYQIQSTTNLMDGFSNDGNPSMASSTNEILTTEFGAQKFYRVQRLK